MLVGYNTHSVDVEFGEGIRAEKIRNHLPHVHGFDSSGGGDAISEQLPNGGRPPDCDQLIFTAEQELIISWPRQHSHRLSQERCLEHLSLVLVHSVADEFFRRPLIGCTDKLERFSDNGPPVAARRKIHDDSSVSCFCFGNFEQDDDDDGDGDESCDDQIYVPS